MKNFPPRRILVPTDSCEPSLSALEAAKVLSNRFGARLELVYVQDLPLSLSGFDMEGSGLGTPGVLKQMAEFQSWRKERLARAGAPFPASRLSVRTLQGSPVRELGRLAQPRRADLVVMGTHGYAGIGRAVFGSVAESVIRQAGVPVLVAHRSKQPFRIKKVLIPYNMEPYADKALRYGLEFARGMGATAWVLFSALKGADSEGYRRSLERHIGSRRLILRSGDPRHAILKEAARGGFDLIVLSAHRRPFLTGQVLGSTAERILRHSNVPLLCVPSGAREPAPAAADGGAWKELAWGKIF